MANLGNTIVNGILRVNGKLNVSDAITAPSFVGALTGNATTATKFLTARLIDGVSFNGTASIIHYGSCSTAAATAEKTVACTGFTLGTGAKITVKFTVTNTAANPTLNVNGTGAKAIYYRGSAISAGYLAANRTYTFIYNGTQYELIGDINTDTNTKVTNTLATTTKAYITGTTSATTNTGTQVFDTGVYLDTTAGMLTATTFKGALSGNATTASSAAKLTTARTINGVSFDGTANITVADSTKLPLAGGTMTGTISSALNGSWLQGGTGERALVKSTSAGSAHTALWSAASTNGKFQIFKYTNYMGFGYESTTAINAGTNSLTYGAFFNESGAFYPSKDNAQTLGTSSVKWNNVYATTFTGALSGNASSATKLATARTIGVSGVTGTAQSFNGTANIVIPITAVPATLLTNKSAIKGSEITNDKHWVPSSDASVANFVSMTAEEYATNASSLATGTIVAITDSAEGYVTTQSTSLTCDLPLDL